MTQPAPLLRRSERFRRVIEQLTIRDESGSIIPLRLSPSQEILWTPVASKLDYNEPIWVIVLKGRQVYSTTFWSALGFVRTVDQPNTDTVILAHEWESSVRIFDTTKRFYEHIPLPKLKPSRVSMIEFPFEEGISRIRVTSAGKYGKGRGTTISCAIASEVAYWQNPEVLFGLRNALPSHVGDTLWVIESTANGIAGMGQTFYDEWKAAVDGRSALIPLFVPYYVVPKYRLTVPLPESEWEDEEKELFRQFGDLGLDAHVLAWRRWAIQNTCHGSLEFFRQEYPSCPEEAFIASTLPAFEHLAIIKQQENIRDPQLIGEMVDGKFFPMTKGQLRLWKKPEEGHQYVVGVDTSEGIKGGDYACAQILDMGTMEQVAVLHGFIQPWDLAKQIAQAGTWYNKALLAVEVQSQGRSVLDYLIRVFNYPNLHLWRGRQAETIRPRTPTLYGWETNVHTRPLLIEAGRRAINTGLVFIRDRGTLDEIRNFGRSDTGKYQAEIGHDDRVLALLIALRSREENYQGAPKAVISPGEISMGELPGGVRVISAADDEFIMRQRFHKVLRDRVKRGAKTWLEL